MRNQTPLAPGEPVSNATVHVVLNDFGPLGRAYVQTDEVDADIETTIENISAASFRIRCGWSPSTPQRAGRVMSPRTLPAPYSATPSPKTDQSEKPRRNF